MSELAISFETTYIENFCKNEADASRPIVVPVRRSKRGGSLDNKQGRRLALRTAGVF